MKFPLFWLVVMLLADMCRASEETWKTSRGHSVFKTKILARMRREVIVSTTTTTKTAVPASDVDIFVRSEGCNDPGKAPDTCGIAYIKVNGKDHSLHGRGINVVVVDARTGVVLETKTYDTYMDANEANRLADFLNSLQEDVIVVVAVQDEASKFFADSAIDALKRLGAKDPIKPEFRGSFAFVGYSGVKQPSWITQQWRGGGQGPSEISVKVPFTPPPAVDIFVRSEGCNDPGKAPNTCGIAYIKVHGKDHSLHGRGINVVVVDARTGFVLETKTYDTHIDANEANRLAGFLNSLQGDVIVVVAVQDEAARFFADSAIDALKRLGAKDPIKPEFRGSFAFVGYSGVKQPSWITQQWRGGGQGPSEISVKVPLTPN